MTAPLRTDTLQRRIAALERAVSRLTRTTRVGLSSDTAIESYASTGISNGLDVWEGLLHPPVTVPMAEGGSLLIILTAWASPGTSGRGDMSYELSGANTAAPSTATGLLFSAPGGRASTLELVTGLTEGDTTVRAQYRSLISICTWINRSLVVIPL